MVDFSDSVQRFLFENYNIRGTIVRLQQSFQTIMSQHAYPPQIQQVLGETLLTAVMLSNSIKYKGQLTIQFKSDGPVKMLVAKCNHKGHIRGLAQWDHVALADAMLAAIGEGQLVITVERDDIVQPYQSIVPLNNRQVSEALAHYFLQSEQLPAKFLTYVDNNQAAGMMVQLMPDTSEEDILFWQKIINALNQIDKSQLFNLDNAAFLAKIFKEHEIRLFDNQLVEFKCNCNITRMEDAIKTFGKTESEAILAEKQRLVVTCEYCGNEYAFDRQDVEKIFKKLH